MIRHACLVLAVLLPAAVQAQSAIGPAPTQSVLAADISAKWWINGNGHRDELDITQVADGTLRGTMYTASNPDNRVTGYYAPGQRVAIILRGDPSRPDQAYVAQVAADGKSMSGQFYALNTGKGGGRAARNVFAFTALRHPYATAAPLSPGATPAAAPNALANVKGRHAIDGNGFLGHLELDTAVDGTLIDSRVYGDTIIGHYAAGTGTLAFLRMSGGLPIQVFVGTATGNASTKQFNGSFFPLNSAAGASELRVAFGWQTPASVPSVSGMIAVSPSAQSDSVVSTQSVSCSAMVLRAFFGDTSSYVDVPRGQTRGIRLAPGATTRRLNYDCRDPGSTTRGQATCAGNANMARIARAANGGTTLACVFRPGLP